MLNKASWPTNGALLLVGNTERLPHGKNVNHSSLEQVAFDYAKDILSVGSTRSAPLFEAGTHLDFRYVAPEGSSQWIKVDQIRELIGWAASTPQISNKKIAIISPGHAMNLQAANAFLKTLEEPSSSTLFILVSDKPALLPATIRSRCFWVRMRAPFNNQNAHTELKIRIQSDLKLLAEQRTDPISLASEWVKHPPKEILHWLLVNLSESIAQSGLENKIKQENLPWKFMEKVYEAKRALEEPNSPNLQLLLESLLIEYIG